MVEAVTTGKAAFWRVEARVGIVQDLPPLLLKYA